MDYNFLAGLMAGGAIMIMLWFAGWLAWVDRQLMRVMRKLIGEE
jgi:hypothetical protein